MSGVALPVIRDDFGLDAEITAWVSAIFTVPFMLLMPVCGRLSDGLGQRRLMLAGIGANELLRVIMGQEVPAFLRYNMLTGTTSTRLPR